MLWEIQWKSTKISADQHSILDIFVVHAHCCVGSMYVVTVSVLCLARNPCWWYDHCPNPTHHIFCMAYRQAPLIVRPTLKCYKIDPRCKPESETIFFFFLGIEFRKQQRQRSTRTFIRSSPIKTDRRRPIARSSSIDHLSLMQKSSIGRGPARGSFSSPQQAPARGWWQTRSGFQPDCARGLVEHDDEA